MEGFQKLRRLRHAFITAGVGFDGELAVESGLGDDAEKWPGRIVAARNQAGITEAQGAPSVAVTLDDQKAGGRRVVVFRQGRTGRQHGIFAAQPLNQGRTDVGERVLARGEIAQMVAGSADEPMGVGGAGDMVAKVDAGHTVEHPGGANVVCSADDTPAVLVDRPGAFADRTCQPRPHLKGRPRGRFARSRRRQARCAEN